MAANPKSFPFMLGWFVDGSIATGTFQLNLSTNWVAFSFVPAQSKTVNNLRMYVSAIAGTLANTDMTVEIQTDSAGNPSGTDVTGGTAQSPAGAPTAGAFINVTGFTAALTGGTQYWVVVKNVNVTQATNNFTIQWCRAVNTLVEVGNPKRGHMEKSTTNSGTTWSGTATMPVAGVRVGYSDSTYEGIIFSNAAQNPTANYQVFGTQEAGAYLLVPPYLRANVIGITAFSHQAVGSPTGNVNFKLYRAGPIGGGTIQIGTNGTLLDSTNTILAAQFGANQRFTEYFSDYVPQPIYPNDLLYVTVADSAGNTDNSSNYYAFKWATADTDSNTLALGPWDGHYGAVSMSSQGVVLATSSSTPLFSMDLILDSVGGEFNWPVPQNLRGGFVN